MHLTNNRDQQQGGSLLEAALEYHRRGWSIIPVRAGTKKPACQSWKQYQSQRPEQAKLRRWFANRWHRSLAVVLGKVSGDLVCRDFDAIESYERWKEGHPDLADTLPTVETARGRHVYFRGDHGRIVYLGDGELRGSGCCVLPPSRHPDGPQYAWLVPLPEGPLPFIEDVRTAGLLSDPPCNRENRENRENRGLQRKTEAMGGCVCCVWRTDLDDEQIERAITESLPERPRTHPGPGQRNSQVFHLARAFKAIPWLADAEADELQPYIRRWHELGVANGVIGTVPFEETWIDFLYAWPRVEFPKGAEPMTAIFEAARKAPSPRAALRYEQEDLRLLVTLCRELQRASGDKPFFLACRTAGKLLEVDHTTAWRWLFLLQHDRVIEEVEKGDRAKQRASRYRYLGD